jgi:8-amino-7-oxononanoate synthase
MSTTTYFERRKEQLEIDFKDRRNSERRSRNQTATPDRRRAASVLRRYERELLKIPVVLRVQGKEIPGVTEDFSPNGLKISSPVAIPSGTPMSLQFSFGDSVCYLNISGRVAFCLPPQSLEGQSGYLIGIKLSGVQEWEQKILISAIEEIGRNRSVNAKSLLSITLSKDTVALEAYGLYPKSPFQAKIGRYRRAKELKRRDLYLYLRSQSSPSGARIRLNGREMIMLGSTNYLGLTNHPKVKAAAMEALEKYGVGAGGVRLLSGSHVLHELLEARLARLKGGEACMVYNSGYTANVGTIATILGGHDIAVLDKKVHASILDGATLARCRIKFFEHNNMGDLEKTLVSCGPNASKLVIVDSLYSMDGDIADLAGIHKLAKAHNAGIMIDEAHATGVLGPTGKGATELFGLEGKIDIVMGTLSKALGGIGGFIVGSRELIEFLKHNARSFVFSEAVPPMICASVLAALDVLENEPHWHKQLWRNTYRMREALKEMGYKLGESASPIIPVIIGNETKTYELTKRLGELGIFACPVAWPAVERTASRIRVCVMGTHTEADIDEAIAAFRKAGQQLGLIRE